MLIKNNFILIIIIYILAEIYKVIFKCKKTMYKFIPSFTLICGGIIGIFIYFNEFNFNLRVERFINSVRYGILGGMSSTGINQFIKQFKKKELNMFINRRSQNLNRKRYEVVSNSVQRNNLGEIESFVADEFREDDPIIEGTSLSAESLTEAFDLEIDLVLLKKLKLIYSDLELLNFDLNNVVIPTTTIQDIHLLEHGELGTTYTWSSNLDSAITIDNGVARVTRSDSTQDVELVCTAVNGSASDTRSWNLQILKIDVPANVQTNIDNILLSSNELSKEYEVSGNLHVRVVNNYEDYVFVQAYIDDNNLLHVSFIKNNGLSTGSSFVVQVKVLLDDISNGVTQKVYTYNIRFSESVESDD